MSSIKKDLKRLGLIAGKKKTNQMFLAGLVFSTILLGLFILEIFNTSSNWLFRLACTWQTLNFNDFECILNINSNKVFLK